MPNTSSIFSSKEARAEAFITYARFTDPPLLVLALLMIPLIALPLLFDLGAAINDAFLAVDWIIWAVFAFDLMTRTYLSERRLNYLKTHWYDVLIVIVPFLRPLRALRSVRALRLARLGRVGIVSMRALNTARAIGQQHGLVYFLAIGGFLLVAGAALVFAFERNSGGPIDDFPTALWWSVVTITTVGYGDAFPVTNEGRGIAVFLMIVGITLFGFLTANIAAYLVEQGSEASLDDVVAKLDTLEKEIKELRGELSRAESSASSVSPTTPTAR